MAPRYNYEYTLPLIAKWSFWCDSPSRLTEQVHECTEKVCSIKVISALMLHSTVPVQSTDEQEWDLLRISIKFNIEEKPLYEIT